MQRHHTITLVLFLFHAAYHTILCYLTLSSSSAQAVARSNSSHPRLFYFTLSRHFVLQRLEDHGLVALSLPSLLSSCPRSRCGSHCCSGSARASRTPSGLRPRRRAAPPQLVGPGRGNVELALENGGGQEGGVEGGAVRLHNRAGGPGVGGGQGAALGVFRLQGRDMIVVLAVNP